MTWKLKVSCKHKHSDFVALVFVAHNHEESHLGSEVGNAWLYALVHSSRLVHKYSYFNIRQAIVKHLVRLSNEIEALYVSNYL